MSSTDYFGTADNSTLDVAWVAMGHECLLWYLNISVELLYEYFPPEIYAKHILLRAHCIGKKDLEHPFRTMFALVTCYNIKCAYLPPEETATRRALVDQPAFLYPLWLGSIWRKRLGSVPLFFKTLGGAGQ